MTPITTRVPDLHGFVWVWQPNSVQQNVATLFRREALSRLAATLQAQTNKDLYWARGTDTLTLGDQWLWIHAKSLLASLRVVVLADVSELEERAVTTATNLQSVGEMLPVDLSSYLKAILAEVDGAERLTVKQLRALKNFISEPGSSFQYRVDELYHHDEY